MNGLDPCPSTAIVIMGVSGSGKSTTGAALAQRWGRVFIDADDLHPPSNKAKMATGIPLDDDDRIPWLTVVSRQLAPNDHGEVPVVACSALKKTYRDLLRASAPGTIFVHLQATTSTLGERVSGRDHEFMPPSLLLSQLATLEPLEATERGVTIDAAQTLADVILAIEKAL